MSSQDTAPRAGRSPTELRHEICCAAMRLPYLRKAAPTCWPPPGPNAGTPPRCCGCCITEEVVGRDAATRRMRRKTAGLPHRQDLRVLATRRLLDPGGHPERADHPGMGRPRGEPRDRRTHPAPARPTSSKPSRTRRSKHDLRVAWFTLESLTATIGRAKVDGSVARTVARICRRDLIVIDDIGMLPAGQDAAEAFYRVVDAAYERRSIAVTSNMHPSGFDTIMPKTLATATVDRLLHHAHLVLTKGDSHRLAEALAGKGVTPLT